ncbi:MBL fold metallo-hydrolase [Pseudomonas sp. LFM046]|uniref:MBL fold metallo-hydrolase n=1 Tax=Pseudomonas sp. LFM046 TaxID=1608357 RepID=UPI0005CFC761|nr:MBL fold metallo-hydrolase [Pseudomonas sp. LFM046]
MKLTLIGHESWSIQAGGTHALVDPILGPSFGSDPQRQFTIFPAREVLLERLPAVDGIVLTSEHLQHFHPASLRYLKNSLGRRLLQPTVLVPELFPGAAEEIVRRCGLDVRRVDSQAEFHIGELTCRFYMPHTGVLYWDNRVASLHVEHRGGEALFIQSDTRIADSYYSDVNEGRVAEPQVMVVTNNFQASSSEETIGLDNLLPVADARYSRISGLRLLEEIIHQPVRRLQRVPALILAGNGYRDPLGNMRQPWSNEELADISSELSLLRAVHCLKPGQCFDVECASLGKPVDWVTLRSQGEQRLRPERCEHAEGPRTSVARIKRHLDEMAKTWLIGRYGQVLMAQSEYLGQSVGPCRLVLQLLRGDASLQLVLDITRVEFVEAPYEGLAVIKRYPYGIRVDYDDFLSLLAGDLQIWEVMNLSASQWYVCDRYDSPLAFWLEYYNEQVDARRALRSYEQSLAQSL